MPDAQREYSAIAASVAGTIGSEVAGRDAAMQAVVDACWTSLRHTGVSWIGFYLDDPQAPDGRRMILGPSRDKPACSPIGLHGACGKALRSGQTLIVRDVRELGSDYIACDPRDQSEIVIPLFEPTGAAWGVLDVDSWDLAAFDASDEAGFKRVLAAAGMLARVK